MQRRTYLRGAATAGVLGTAGCLGLGDSNPDVALPEPDREYTSEELPYPAWGQRIPDATLPDPIDGGEVSVRSVGKPQLLTFFYSHCNTVCPVLIQSMRNVQAHSLEQEYADAVAFFPVTFDPQRDDAERLRTYGEEMNVALDAGNWHFLRPESKARAKAVVQEQFGVNFQRTHPDNMDMYMFAHSAMTYLVNSDGYVERAYRTDSPDPEQIIDDLETVRNR
ncbi:SCO family protein [Halobellus inordinatus]|uniref:SCO family protein n=1 Tax=Halobellus inordinatus TaxID=1126236 RepID=UPI00210C640F|nr:SCO family protein [Halobellus inordinatus]